MTSPSSSTMDDEPTIKEILENYRAASFSPIPFEPDYSKWNEKHEKIHQSMLEEAEAALQQLIKDASEQPQLPVIIDGKQVGTLPLTTEYRIMIDHMLLDMQFELDYFRKRLKEIDDAVNGLVGDKPLAKTDVQVSSDAQLSAQGEEV